MIFFQNSIESAQKQKGGGEGQWLTERSHSSATHSAEASSAAGDFGDGEVSGETEDINVFLSSRGTC